MKASVEIEFLDGKGELVEPPFDIGTDYTVQVVVTNRTTTTGGHPWEASFEIGIGISLDGIDIAPYTVYPPREFAPEQFQHFIETFYIPRPWAGLDGLVIARVFDPFGKVLASAQKRFAIGYEVSPEAIYEVPGKILATQDMPFLSPDEGLSDGVVMGVNGAERQPPAPAPPPKPKPVYDPNDKRVPVGIDCNSEPEPPVEFEGETGFGGRLG